MLGSSTIAEWYPSFEASVGSARWEALAVPHTLLEEWGDPGAAAWSRPLLSPCELQPASPDRIVFFAGERRYKSENDWITGLTAAVNALRARYPSAREIDLLTVLRGPSNAPCGEAQSFIEPFVDRAMARVSAQFEGLVQVGPKFEASSCGVFASGGASLSARGRSEVAHQIADFFQNEL